MVERWFSIEFNFKLGVKTMESLIWFLVVPVMMGIMALNENRWDKEAEDAEWDEFRTKGQREKNEAIALAAIRREEQQLTKG